MDLVRLGLERAATAQEALDLMIALLERHGQGGDCGHLARFYYHNSFLIADPSRAFVLESVGRWWAVKEVQGVRALSNVLSIGAHAERLSPALEAHARDEGWCDAAGCFDFAGRLIDGGRDAITFGAGRCARAGALLAEQRGALTAGGMMAILRDHGVEAGRAPGWRPADTVGRTLCMHAAQGARRSQTTGSLVSELRPAAPATIGGAVHWVTGSAAPCLSLFKPVLFAAGLPGQGPPPTDRFDAAARWWRHERLHREVLRDFAPRAAVIAKSRDALEAIFAERMDQALAADKSPGSLRAAVDECWREADAAERNWWAGLAPITQRSARAGSYERSWARLNHVAGMSTAFSASGVG
jgi:dipeptidase